MVNCNLLFSRQRCWFCLDVVSADSAPLCKGCLAHLPVRPSHYCQRCALPLPGAALCSECAATPPAFICAHIPLIYDRQTARLVEPIKRQAHSAALPLLAKLCAPLLQQRSGQPPLQLVGIPLHPRRALQRGFSQATLLARLIAPLFAGSATLGCAIQLQRLHHQAPQKGQNRQQRLTNSHGNFAAGEVVGLHIGLVDDVVTTTATARSAAAALMAAGAASVELIAAVRTPKPNSRQ